MSSAFKTFATFCAGEIEMPNRASLTYGQLHGKLRNLGNQEHKVEMNGKVGRVFENKAKGESLIVLPERKPDDVVEPFYMNYVLMILKSRGLLPECNPLLA
jgi:hypothetical protein